MAVFWGPCAFAWVVCWLFFLTFLRLMNCKLQFFYFFYPHTTISYKETFKHCVNRDKCLFIHSIIKICSNSEAIYRFFYHDVFGKLKYPNAIWWSSITNDLNKNDLNKNISAVIRQAPRVEAAAPYGAPPCEEDWSVPAPRQKICRSSC